MIDCQVSATSLQVLGGAADDYIRFPNLYIYASIRYYLPSVQLTKEYIAHMTISTY